MAETRRGFLKVATAGLAVDAGLAAADEEQKVMANDKICVASIGVGGMGMGNARYAVSIPGVELVAACDLYESRLARARELFGNQIATTRDYREILARRDVDAVIVSTPDHWHSQITIEALNAGKDVFCEKPMVQKLEQGKPVIEAQERTGRIVQIGSQYATNILFHQVNELIRSGALGELSFVEAFIDGNTAIAGWLYSIPPDASAATIDWERFLGNAPKRPFDPVRFFRWRLFRDYGTCLGGDLFVHLLSGIHVATGALGPTRVSATGGLRFWKDGRDAPDVLIGMLDYPRTDAHPAFNVMLRGHFKTGGLPGSSFIFRFVGSEGQAVITGASSLVISKVPPESEPGYIIDSFSKATQDKFLEGYRKAYPSSRAGVRAQRPVNEERRSLPKGYDAHREHQRSFYAAVRSRKRPLQDAVFGFRTAGPSLLCNKSQAEQREFRWDPVSMTVPSQEG